MLLAGLLLGFFFDSEDGGDMSVEYQCTTQHYIQEDINLHDHRCENSNPTK
jgi:hypothetical protein